MRTLLGLSLTAIATALLCHGLFLDPAAHKAASAGRAGETPRLHLGLDYPFSPATLDQRRKIIDSWAARPPARPDDLADTDFALVRLRDGLSEDPPWLAPPAAASLAIVALFLALILPRTRFRSLALLGLLIGTAGVAPLLLHDSRASEIINATGILTPAFVYAPWTAIGMLYLGALALSFGVPRRERVLERVEYRRD